MNTLNLMHNLIFRAKTEISSGVYKKITNLENSGHPNVLLYICMCAYVFCMRTFKLLLPLCFNAFPAFY